LGSGYNVVQTQCFVGQYRIRQRHLTSEIINKAVQVPRVVEVATSGAGGFSTDNSLGINKLPGTKFADFHSSNFGNDSLIGGGGNDMLVVTGSVNYLGDSDIENYVLSKGVGAISLGSPQRYVVVAAPSFLKQHGIPRTPADLLGKPAIGTLFPSQALLLWEFQKRGKTVRMTPRGPFMSGHVGVQRRAAIDGLGFPMTFEGYVSKEVAAGTLVVVLDDWCPRFPGPYLYYPGRRQPPPALRAFLGFVQDWRSRRR